MRTVGGGIGPTNEAVFAQSSDTGPNFASGSRVALSLA